MRVLHEDERCIRSDWVRVEWMCVGAGSRRRMRLTARRNLLQESTSIARVEVPRQTAKPALQGSSHLLEPQAVSHRPARRIRTLRRAVSLVCATQDTRGLMAGHAKLAAPGRTRTRLAPAHALHASPVSIPRRCRSPSSPFCCLYITLFYSIFTCLYQSLALSAGVRVD